MVSANNAGRVNIADLIAQCNLEIAIGNSSVSMIIMSYLTPIQQNCLQALNKRFYNRWVPIALSTLKHEICRPGT